MSKLPTIGWSDFALKNSVKSKGRSYTMLDPNKVIERLKESWWVQEPGDGETDCTRKILVSVAPEEFFLPPKAKLVEGMPVQAEVVKREGQTNEDPYIEIFVTPEDAAKFGYVEQPAKSVKIVLYSAKALTENNEERSTDCEWEIIAILCSENDGETEPMAPLTMARNFLEKEGGTKSVYTAQEFAEAIYRKSNSGVRVRPHSK